MASSQGEALGGIGVTQAAMLRYLRRQGFASRAEIAELCGITPAAVSMMTRDLLERGIIAEGPRRQGGRGAPHIDLTLQKSVGYALGIHASRYSITLTLLDFGGELVGERQLRGTYGAFSDARSAIQANVGDLLASAGLNQDALIGAGVAMPTRFTREASPLDLAEEVVSWAGSDLTGSLREALGCPVIIENDANAAAMGELTVGNSARYENFAYLYLSEGIGGAVIIENQLYRGNLGNAGEIGALRPRGMPRPSFEDLANWCAERAGKPPVGRVPEEWDEYLRLNCDVLEGWLDRAGPELARLAFIISAVLAPAAIYVGGSLPHIVRQRMMGWLDFANTDLFEGARVVQPKILLPDVSASDSVAFGAAAMILHNINGEARGR